MDYENNDNIKSTLDEISPNENTIRIANAMDSRPQNFYDLYYNTIEPLINPYENNRIKSLNSTIIKIIFSDIGILILGYIIYNIVQTFLFLNEDIIKTIFSITFILLIVVPLCIWSIANDKIKATAKINILNPITKLLGNLTWTNEIKIHKENIQVFGFAMKAKVETPDDTFSGLIEKVPVQIQETKLEHIEGSGKHRRWVTDFKGVAIILTMNKDFTGRTLVMRDKGQLLGINMNSTSYFGMEHIALESIEFEKEFEVYSTDQVEARYILTTSFMEKLENIKKFFNARYVECGFYQGEILILLHTNKNLFEVGDLIHSFKNKLMYETAYNEIKSLIEMIKHLKLNIKTGL